MKLGNFLMEFGWLIILIGIVVTALYSAGFFKIVSSQQNFVNCTTLCVKDNMTVFSDVVFHGIEVCRCRRDEGYNCINRNGTKNCEPKYSENVYKKLVK